MISYNIDDITWNDLSMEDVYSRINCASSSVGEEYLKKILRNTQMNEDSLKERSVRADYLERESSFTKSLQKIYKNLGKTKKISLYDYIFRFNEIKPAGNAAHYIMILLLLAAIALIFINPVIGIIALVVMFVVNISTYFKYKAQIEGYFMCFKYITRMLWEASGISSLVKNDARKNSGNPFISLSEQLDRICSELHPLKRRSWLLTNSVSGSLIDVVMDYIRMLFHVDIIKFNNMRRLASDKTAQIDELFCVLGEIESDICISVYRQSLGSWCRPDFAKSDDPDKGTLVISGMYHPLTLDPVKNDITITKGILLTGSNASGKSTFLKQLAINQIFAQTIYTVLADSYRTGFYKVMSSMALSDNILGNESYFIVEIKSLKRIFDETEKSLNDDSENPVMCFIDEVLRGTNTKERIAASSQILINLAKKRALCFAATHDYELTRLLEDWMDNYHFREYVNGNDIEFDYRIHKGAAVSRNAIALMKSFGFDTEITDEAEKMVRM